MAYLEIKTTGVVSRAKLDDFATAIGRHPDSAIVINDPDISRRHCVIEKSGEGFCIHDLGSRNGTKVNGRRVQRQTLSDGDVIQIGSTKLRFHVGEVAHARRSASVARNKTLLWGGVGVGFAAGVILTAWLSGMFGQEISSKTIDASRADGATIAAAVEPTAASADAPASPAAVASEETGDDDISASNRIEQTAAPQTYELITGETLHTVAGRANHPIRARFFGSAMRDAAGNLQWELPPAGDLIAVLAPGSLVYDALLAEPEPLELELFGIVQRSSNGQLCLRVGEVQIIRAWFAATDQLQPATRALLGRTVVADERFTVGALKSNKAPDDSPSAR